MAADFTFTLTMRGDDVSAYDLSVELSADVDGSAPMSISLQESMDADGRMEASMQCDAAGLMDLEFSTDSHRVQVGESIGNFYGFKVVDVDSEGRWIYEDRNGELVNYKDFTHAPEDKHVIGNGLPKWYAGWNNTLRYKNFDLNVTMRGAFGFQIINGGRMNYENVKNSRFENRLKSVNDLVFGKHTLSSEVEPEFNSYYVENGDYWKIDNITLGYSFGQVGKYIKSLRVYGSVLNALTITGYKGIDPEVSTDGLTPGYDTRDRYPSVRSFTFGVNVKF